MDISQKKWTVALLIIVGTCLFLAAGFVYVIDPYFHYRKPADWFYYELRSSAERNVNNGIQRNFDYDAYIIGTSMTENFKTSEFDALFGVHSVKIPFAGATYREINENQERGFLYNDHIKTVVRGLDYDYLLQGAEDMKYDSYPTYLYDEDPFNDINYLLNRDTMINIFPELLKTITNGGGITSFDDYANWNDSYVFGEESVKKASPISGKKDGVIHKSLTDEENERIRTNIRENVVMLAAEHPETTFYYFFTPYSVYYWGNLYNSGDLQKQIEAERIAIEEILKQPNIKLYSFNNMSDITTNLDNYKDDRHYGEWVNTEILRMMKDGKGLLVKDNYREYLKVEEDFYSNFDYDMYIGISQE